MASALHRRPWQSLLQPPSPGFHSSVVSWSGPSVKTACGTLAPDDPHLLCSPSYVALPLNMDSCLMSRMCRLWQQ